jgi:flagellar biosynthetic protein FliQ
MTELCDLVRQAVWTVMIVAAPMLLVGLLVAAVVGLVQSATGIHEPVLALVPRLAAMATVLLITLPWMAERLVDLLVQAAVPPS